MKYTTLFSILLLSVATATAAPLYVCKRGGVTEYTAEAKPGCKPMEEKKVAGYAPSYSGSSSSYSYSESNSFETQNNQQDNNRAAAEQRLRDAERALEEGRNTRLGNERNYAKYEERIKGLEEEVRRAREALGR